MKKKETTKKRRKGKRIEIWQRQQQHDIYNIIQQIITIIWTIFKRDFSLLRSSSFSLSPIRMQTIYGFVMYVVLRGISLSRPRKSVN